EVGGATFVAVAELALDLDQIAHLQQRRELLIAAAAARHPFARRDVLVETDAELRRPLEDVKELAERQIEQREDDRDRVQQREKVVTVALHPRVARGEEQSGDADRGQQDQRQEV